MPEREVSLLKIIVGGFFYIVPDEQLLNNYKPLFKNYSLFNIIIIALVSCSFQMIYPLSILLSKRGEILKFLFNHSSKLNMGTFFSVDALTVFSALIAAPIIENFIFFKFLVSIKNRNVNSTIFILSLIAALWHWWGGKGLNSIIVFFVFWILMDIFLGGYKQGKNGYLLSVIFHSLGNLLIITTYGFLYNVSVMMK